MQKPHGSWQNSRISKFPVKAQKIPRELPGSSRGIFLYHVFLIYSSLSTSAINAFPSASDFASASSKEVPLIP